MDGGRDFAEEVCFHGFWFGRISFPSVLSRTVAESFRISFGGVAIVRGPTLPSVLLGADAKRGYEGNLLFVGQFAKPRNV